MTELTDREYDDFRAFCQQATDRQLHGIYEKERNRPAYRRIVREVATARGVCLD
jgi:hypothetical protein